jgi:hypothetical protein
MLSVSGNLDPSIPQSHPFPQVDTWGFTIHQPFHAVYDSNHRSVYLMVQRNRRHPFLALFDAADPNQSIASRQPTTTPTQALYLMNAPFVHDQAESFAKKILASHTGMSSRICNAFEMAHGRVPNDFELESAAKFVTSYHESLKHKVDEQERESAAWSALARVLLTSNAFLYLD